MGVGISSKEVSGNFGKCCLHEVMGRNRLGITPDGGIRRSGNSRCRQPSEEDGAFRTIWILWLRMLPDRMLGIQETICAALSVLICRVFGESSPPLPTPHPHRRQRLTPVSLSHLGRILDLKTGTVKKEGQQSSMRMCMGSRRSFICRMRCVGCRGAVAVGGPLLLSSHGLCCCPTSGSQLWPASLQPPRSVWEDPRPSSSRPALPDFPPRSAHSRVGFPCPLGLNFLPVLQALPAPHFSTQFM